MTVGKVGFRAKLNAVPQFGVCAAVVFRQLRDGRRADVSRVRAAGAAVRVVLSTGKRTTTQINSIQFNSNQLNSTWVN